MPKTQRQTRSQVEINTTMFGYITGQFTFDAVLDMLHSDVIGPDDYIEMTMDSGLKAAVRKRDIISVEEVE